MYGTTINSHPGGADWSPFDEALGGLDPRIKILTKLPNVMKTDGKMVAPSEREEAQAAAAEAV